MARADTGWRAIRKRQEAFLSVADNCMRKFKNAVRLFRVVMHNVSRLAVPSGKGDRGLVQMRPSPKKRGKKQRSNEQDTRETALFGVVLRHAANLRRIHVSVNETALPAGATPDLRAPAPAGHARLAQPQGGP